MPLYALADLVPDVPPAGEWWLAPDADVIGAVRIGPGCGIWFGAVLRGDNAPITLGARCNVQEHAVLHVDADAPVVVGDDVTIGHRAIVHGCTVGSNTLIGMGAIVLSRATIGRDSLVGAGALVPEGRAYPDGSLLIGAPARVARPLRPDEITALTRSSAHYVANWRRFQATLRPD